MKLRFKKQPYQDDAVNAVTCCFQGQPHTPAVTYRIDPGRSIEASGQLKIDDGAAGFRNSPLAIPLAAVLANVQTIQARQNLPISKTLKSDKICDLNLDVEMETGTGKTYCYIKTMFELHRLYGWSKFIVVVPSIAIREGVHKSLGTMAEHFLEQYGRRIRSFIYNSKQLHELESYSSDAGINVMVINVQAFNARGKDARRIYEELDDFQSRRPIDVISANRPILILDEPQKMEGAKTLDGLSEFKPLLILRYSATHKQEFNKIYRLDALDAYNQKLVKKISVHGVAVKGLAGTNAYLYFEAIEISPSKPPVAKLEMELRQESGIKRVVKRIGKEDNLFAQSLGLDQYKGFVVSEIDARDNTLHFTNGVILHVGDAVGDVTESALRRIQIREAVKVHFAKEAELFPLGIKVLSLFFIDEVAKYRSYDDSGEVAGEYAKAFEEEYNLALNEVLTLEDTPYNRYLRSIETNRTHNGYFSIDKKTKRLIDPGVSARTSETDDVDAYDLILKDKERLLSFEEPVRFIFSHSALREGWDNPNVFVICTLKHSDNTVSRRQEVGRGLRLCVNQHGDRIDNPAIVHDLNVLTVIASESYKDFVAGLQKEIVSSLASRPRKADEAYFSGKMFRTEMADVLVTPQMAKSIYKYLLKNDYSDDADQITAAYTEAKTAGTLAPLPADLEPYTAQIHQLIESVITGRFPDIQDNRGSKPNPINANFHKKEFQALWNKINRKAAYAVDFETSELIANCIASLDRDLNVTPLQYTVQRGEQAASASYEALKQGKAFQVEQTSTSHLTTSIHSAVRYDLIGKICEATDLTRRTVGTILHQIRPSVFAQYRTNPEDFMRKAAVLINEQKASVIVEHLTYSPVEETYSTDIFTAHKPKDSFSRAFQATHHVYDYVFTDSAVERKFVEELDTATEVEVYAKLPRAFYIPTPVGNYSPDWAIAFKQGTVRHVYFIAETKGSLSTLEMREIEKTKLDCARRFFARITSEQVKYDVVDSYGKLMELVS